MSRRWRWDFRGLGVFAGRIFSALKRLATGVKSGHQETEATGIMEHHRRTHRTATAAFTLRELVVVLALLSLLGGMFLTALNQRASWQIKKAQCAANLRQFAQATQLYAVENNDKLPVSNHANDWAWDVPATITDSLLRYGMTPRAFYCPGTSPRFNDQLNFLNGFAGSLWNWPASFRIIGYATTFSGSGIVLSNQNTTILPENPRINSFIVHPVPPNNERVLVADATISNNRGGSPANPIPAGSFSFIVGGFPVPHLSPHLKGELPAGGNLAFKDGHVAWRKFMDMSQRASGLASPAPGFWW